MSQLQSRIAELEAQLSREKSEYVSTMEAKEKELNDVQEQLTEKENELLSQQEREEGGACA